MDVHRHPDLHSAHRTETLRPENTVDNSIVNFRTVNPDSFYRDCALCIPMRAFRVPAHCVGKVCIGTAHSASRCFVSGRTLHPEKPLPSLLREEPRDGAEPNTRWLWPPGTGHSRCLLRPSCPEPSRKRSRRARPESRRKAHPPCAERNPAVQRNRILASSHRQPLVTRY